MCNAWFLHLSRCVSRSTSTVMNSDSCQYRLLVLFRTARCIGRCNLQRHRTLQLSMFSPTPSHGATAPSGLHGFMKSLSCTHHTRQDSSGRVTSPTQRPLPNNTQHSQKTGIHAPGRIRTHNPSKGAAADPRLRPRGHRHRPIVRISREN